MLWQRIPAILALALLSSIVFAYTMSPIDNSDFGWHVAMGRWVVEHGEVPDREPSLEPARNLLVVDA